MACPISVAQILISNIMLCVYCKEGDQSMVGNFCCRNIDFLIETFKKHTVSKNTSCVVTT